MNYRDKSKTLLQLLSNACGSEFEDENLAVSIIEETLEAVANPEKDIQNGIGIKSSNMTKLEISEKFKDHIKAKGLTGETVSPMLYWEMIEFIDELVNKSDIIAPR